MNYIEKAKEKYGKCNCQCHQPAFPEDSRDDDWVYGVPCNTCIHDHNEVLVKIVRSIPTLLQESNEEATKKERDRWLNQTANEHDKKIAEEAVRYGMALELENIDEFINEGTNFEELKFYLLGRYNAMKTALDKSYLSSRGDKGEI